MITIQFIGLVGRTGAGKGLEANRLAADLESSIVLPFGQRIRDSADVNHPYHGLCRELRQIADAGQLPDLATVQPLLKRMLDEEIRAGQHYLIADGLPRVPGVVQFLAEYGRHWLHKATSLESHTSISSLPKR